MDDELQHARGGAWRWIAVVAGLVVAAAVGYFVWSGLSRSGAGHEPSTNTVVTPPPGSGPAQPRAEPEPPPNTDTAMPAPRRRPRPEKPAEPAAPVAAGPAGPVLVIDSDVPGASVFVDRQYLGTTPVRTTAVKPGTHQLNASAEGQDGIARTIEVSDAGETSIGLRFRDVQIDASVAVVHKHGIGSCEGRLLATIAGLRYETSNKGDAFSIGFGDLETFEIDYLQKNLRVKKHGGKTWNFTDKSENADKLFVFHRDVTKAREKLAGRR
jgi:hypothetical protein